MEFNCSKYLYVICVCNCNVVLCDLLAGPSHGGREGSAHGCRNTGSDEALRQRSATNACAQRCPQKVSRFTGFVRAHAFLYVCICLHLHVFACSFMTVLSLWSNSTSSIPLLGGAKSSKYASISTRVQDILFDK